MTKSTITPGTWGVRLRQGRIAILDHVGAVVIELPLEQIAAVPDMIEAIRKALPMLAISNCPTEAEEILKAALRKAGQIE